MATMSAMLFNLIKALAIGLILGYVACYVFKKGIIIFIVILIIGLFGVHIAGVEDSVEKIWSVIEGFVIFSIKNTFQTVYVKLSSIGGKGPFILGVFAGSVWCLFFSK